MSILKKIKDWLTGSSSSSSKSNSNKSNSNKNKSSSSSTTNKIKEANRTSYYGGGVSSTRTQTEVKNSINKAQQKQKDEEEARRQQVMQAFKASTPSTKSVKKVASDAKVSATQKSVEKSASKVADAFKATPPKPLKSSSALGNVSSKQKTYYVARKAKAEADKTMRNYQASRLKPKIYEKYSGNTQESKIRRKQGEWQYDPDVAKYDVLKHPAMESFARGTTSGATFGLSELAAAKLKRNNGMDEAERVYQENKNKLAEFGGEMAGSLVGFGVTGDLSKQAVSKITPNAIKKYGATKAEQLATNKIVVDSAKREALKKFGTTATESQIAQLARNKATKLIEAVGEDAAINLTTGLVSDVTHAWVDSDNPAEFAKNMFWNTIGNVALGTVPTVGAELYRNSGLDDALSAAGREAIQTIDNKSGGIKLSGEKAKPEILSTGKNWISGEDVAIWKDGNNLFVGNPNGEFKSFGKDLPENRIKAEDEFDFLNNKRTQQFREARGEKQAKSKATKPKAEERPRPEGVKKYTDKQLLEMKKNGSINKLTREEYNYYIYERPENDPFFEKWDSIGSNGKTKNTAQANTEEPKASAEKPKAEKATVEEPETKTLTKKQLENKKKRSDKRLKEIEGEIKRSPYASQYEQEALSAKYTKELEYRKKLDAQIKEAEESADGSITVKKGKKNAAKEVDESNVAVTKGKEELVDEPPKEKKQKQKNAKAEAKAEAEIKVEAEEPKSSKKVASLENKIRNSDKQIDKFKKQIAEKKKEGASEKVIANLEAQRKAEMERRKGFRKELKELTGSSEVSKTVEPPKVEAKTEIKTTGNKKIDSLEKKVAYANDNINTLKKTLKEKQANGASEKSIAYTEEQLAKERARLKDLKKELNVAKKEAEAKVDIAEAAQKEGSIAPKATKNIKVETKKGAKPAAETLKTKAENTDKLATYKKNQKKAIEEAKAQEAKTVEVGNKKYSAVDESPFDEASTRTKRETPTFTPKEETTTKTAKQTEKKVKEAKGKAKQQERKFRRNPMPRGENLHKGTVKEVTGKELDEAINPPSFDDYVKAKKTYAKGQASREKEVVSRAGTSLTNATTAESQREFLEKGWRDGIFNYSRIKNKEKYADVMKRFVDEPDAVSREIIKYNNDMSSLSADKVVDTHYQAHCVMKMLRKELDNPALTSEEKAAVKELYSNAASLSQKLSSLSGQVNQFQGVMVSCSPARRADNAIDNIVSILDSSRGFRKKTKIEIDGKKVPLSDNLAERRNQIRALLLENEDISKDLKKVYDATTAEEYGEAMSELMLSTYKLNHATAFDVIQQWRYMAMLGNPKTHLRNLIGNTTFGALRHTSNTVRAIEENVLGGYAKKHNLEIDYHGGFSGKAYREARVRKLAKDDASKAAWESFDKHKNEILGQNKYDTPQMAKLFEWNTKLLGKEDDLFRAPAYREQYIKSYRKFAKKGEITDEILSRIHNEALKESRIATFNEFSELAQVLAKSQRGLYDANATAGQKAVAHVSNALLPFTKVPANILKQSVNYSPAGAIKAVAHIRDAARSGNSELFNTALDELASGFTGTGIAALGYMFGKNTDIFTTNAGSEDAAAKFKKLQGVQNYSATVKMPNGKTYSFTLDWMVPASCTFFMGVELANQLKNSGANANWWEAASNLSQITSRVIDPVLETSMLSGVYNIVENSRKSASYDDQQSFANIAFREIMQSYLSSFVPTLQGQIARTAYDSDKMVVGEDDWEYWVNSMKVKMGLANKDILTGRLGADVNAYGEVKNPKDGSFGSYAKSFVKNAVLPTNIQEVNLTDVDRQKIKEYEDYVAEGGDPADKDYLFPKKSYKTKFNYGKKGADPESVKLTNEQVSLYNQAKTTGGGEAMRVVLEGIMFNRYDKDSNGKRTILKDGYTKEEKEKLIAKFEGKSMREVEQWLYEQPQFKTADEEEKRKVINKLWSYSSQGTANGAKRVGEQAVVIAQGGDVNKYNFKNEVSKTKQLNIKDALDEGIVTYEEVVDFARNAGKTYYYENDEGGSSSTYYNKKQMLEYLASKGYSEEKAAALFNAFKASNAKPYGSSSGRRGWGRRWRRWSHGGGGGSGSAKSNVKTGSFKPQTVHPSSGSSSSSAPKTNVKVKSTANAGAGSRSANAKVSTTKPPTARANTTSNSGARRSAYGGGTSARRSSSTANTSTNVRRSQSRISTSSTMPVTPLNIKTVKANNSNARSGAKQLAAALKDIENTQKKVAPPKARRK